jgi:hypothetical protein
MILDKKNLVFAGIGLFFLIVFLNSSKNIQLNEISENNPDDPFDHSKLPNDLQPPLRLDDSEPIPSTATPKKYLSGINLMPRFDL